MSLITSEINTDIETVDTLYYNRPQLLVNAIDANESYNVMGRGTGKSEGILAPRAHRMLTLMPRCAIVNVAETYMQLWDRTIPPMMKRLQEMGLRRDVDFWVRRFPPKNIGLNFPYMTPETAEHSIFLRVNKTDVSVMRLVSQDRPGTSNGMSIDGIIGDEAKYLKKEKLDSELFPTNRGNERYFSNCHLHHGLMFTTDMPTTASGKWILEYEKIAAEELHAEAAEIVLAIQIELYQIEARARKRGKYTQAEYYEYNKLSASLSELRRGLVHYSEASTLDNIEVLGVDFIKKLKRSLPDFIFRTSVLNEKPGKAENTFYPDLTDRHFYNALDYAFIDGQPESNYGKGLLDSDCRKDLDLDRSEPLEVALDVGGRINVMSIGQAEGRDIQVINAMDVLHPKKVRDLAKDLHNYYKHYSKKEIIIYYDHTHASRNPTSDTNPLEEFGDELDSFGWDVTLFNVGVTASYRNRYLLWEHLLTSSPVMDQYTVRFNQENTKVLRTSMEQTKVALNGKTGFEKDKRMERKEDVNQREAPHYSDSVDTLVIGMIKRRLISATSSTAGLIL